LHFGLKPLRECFQEQTVVMGDFDAGSSECREEHLLLPEDEKEEEEEEEEEEPEQEPKGGVQDVASSLPCREEMQRRIALLEASLAELKGKGKVFGKDAGSGAGPGKGSSSKSSFQPKVANESGKGSYDSGKPSSDVRSL